jgi:hypothetical protein
MLGATGAQKMNPDGLTILKASYGIGTQFVDVTGEVKGLANNGDLGFTVSAQSLGILDPNPGTSKILQIQYRVNGGHPKLEKYNDGDQVSISVPNVPQKTVNHKWSFMKYVWTSLFFFFVGLLVIDGYKAGNKIFGYQKVSETGDITYENVGAGVILAGITLFTFGTSWIYVLLPMALIFGFMRRQR